MVMGGFCLYVGSCLFFFFILSASGSVLQKFLDETADMSSDDRAKHLEKNMVRKTCR